MSTTALLLGLGAGAGALWLLHKRAQANAGDGSSACDALCAAAAKQGIPVDACREGASYKACKAISDLFQGWDDKDAANKALNGDVELPLGPLGDRTVGIGSGGAGVVSDIGTTGSANVANIKPGQGLYGTVARFRNGCVPFSGLPGFEKCKPGTYDMKTAGDHFTVDPQSGGYVPTRSENAFTGNAGDPFTQGPFKADRTYAMRSFNGSSSQSISEPAFPLPLADGETGFYYKGQPYKCAKGTAPQFNVHDQRSNGGPPPCAAPDGSGGFASSGPAIKGKFGNATSSSSFDCTNIPAGFTWDRTLGGGVGGWRRARAGEQIDLGPCAPQPVQSGNGSSSRASSLGGLPVWSGGPRT